MTVIEIVSEHLVRNGFDGLLNGHCGCCIGDLRPCDDDFSACKPAYKHTNDAGEFAMSTRKDVLADESTLLLTSRPQPEGST